MPLKLVEYECAEYKEEYSQTCRPEKRCQVGYLLFIEHRPVAVDDMRQQTKEYRVKNAELRRGIRELNHNNKELKREKQALVSLLESKGMSQSEINAYLMARLN